jgi:hypothetical protein
MPYDIIRHKYGIDSVYLQEFFGLEEDNPGILSKYLKNYPEICA